MATCTMPAFSTRNSTLPAFTSRTAVAAELGGVAGAEHLPARLFERIPPFPVDRRRGLFVALAVLGHRVPYTTSRPRLRAVPSIVRIACSTFAAVRSGIFR